MHRQSQSNIIAALLSSLTARLHYIEEKKLTDEKLSEKKNEIIKKVKEFWKDDKNRASAVEKIMECRTVEQLNARFKKEKDLHKAKKKYESIAKQLFYVHTDESVTDRIWVSQTVPEIERVLYNCRKRM